MSTINIDFGKTVKEIKDINCVNCAPYCASLGGNQTKIIKYFKDLDIPYSRLHDCCGRYGGTYYVDVPNIFRNFDADEYAEESYDFYYTDEYIKGIIDGGAKAYYRLGITIDWGSKKYHTNPPKDYKKWAVICEHIIKHYNEGWNNGFHYDLEYWEIWNEPENPPMWSGTKEQFFDLYKTAATYLKEKFPNIKIGGYGSCGFYSIHKEDADDFKDSFISFFYEFLDMVKKYNVPLDFYSWHTYSDSLEKFVSYMKFAKETLDKYGFSDVEIHCNEWNVGGEGNGYHLMRNMVGASYIASAMCIMQNTDYVDKAAYYVFSEMSGYNGFYDLNIKKRTCTYYAFKAFGNCHRLKNQVCVENQNRNLQTVAASDGTKCSALISNYDGELTETTVKFSNLPEDSLVYVDYISENCEAKTQIYKYDGTKAEINLSMPKHSVVTINVLPSSEKDYNIYLDCE